MDDKQRAMLEWCGWRAYKEDSHIWYPPGGDIAVQPPDTYSLDWLFKYAVPRIGGWQLNLSLCRTKASAHIHTEQAEAHVQDEDPARALHEAIGRAAGLWGAKGDLGRSPREE